jgi:hypothetical protein
MAVLNIRYLSRDQKVPHRNKTIRPGDENRESFRAHYFFREDLQFSLYSMNHAFCNKRIPVSMSARLNPANPKYNLG